MAKIITRIKNEGGKMKRTGLEREKSNRITMGKAVFGVRLCFEAERGQGSHRRIIAKCLIDLLFFYMFIFKKKAACKQLTIYQE